MIGIIMKIIKIINTASHAIFLHLILRNGNRLPHHTVLMNIAHRSIHIFIRIRTQNTPHIGQTKYNNKMCDRWFNSQSNKWAKEKRVKVIWHTTNSNLPCIHIHDISLLPLFRFICVSVYFRLGVFAAETITSKLETEEEKYIQFCFV